MGSIENQRHTSQRSQVVRISGRGVSATLYLATLLLLIAHIIFTLNELHGFDFFGSTQLYVIFDVTGEVTVPTWFSSSLLLLAAVIAGFIAHLLRQRETKDVFYWVCMATILLALSIEESADVHGAVSYRMSDSMDAVGPLTYPWVIPGAILAIVVGIVFIPFVLRLATWFRNRLIIAGCLYLGGALVLEVVGAIYDSNFGDETVLYTFLVTVEEGLEMGAIVFLIGALIMYLEPLLRGSTIDISR